MARYVLFDHSTHCIWNVVDADNFMDAARIGDREMSKAATYREFDADEWENDEGGNENEFVMSLHVAPAGWTSPWVCRSAHFEELTEAEHLSLDYALEEVADMPGAGFVLVTHIPLH